MSTRQIPFLHRGWENGVNDSKNLLDLRANELSDIRNFYVARDAHLKRRAGSDAVYDTSFQGSAVAHGMAQTRLASTRYLITTYGTAIRPNDSAVITGTAVLTAGANNPVKMVTFKDLVVGTQSDTVVGLNAPFAWNGSGNAAPLTTSPPSLAVAAATFKNRLFFGNATFGGTAYPEHVVWSLVNTATTWPTNQLAGIYPGTGKYITALTPFFRGGEGDGEVLIIHKDTGTFYGYHDSSGAGASAFRFGVISDSIGCPAPLGVVEAAGTLYWPSYGGFYRMDQDMTLNSQRNYIGGPLEQLWSRVPKNRIPHIKGGYLEDLGQVWFAISVASTVGGAQTTNNYILVFDTYFQRWVGIYDKINANVIASVIDASLNRWLYTGDYTNFKVYKQNTTNDDDGTGFEAWAKTGYWSLNSPGLKKGFRRVALEVSSDSDKVGSLTFNLYNVTTAQAMTASISSPGVDLDTFTLDQDVLAGAPYQTFSKRIGGRSHYVQTELRLPANNRTFDLYGLGFYVVPKRTGPGVPR